MRSILAANSKCILTMRSLAASDMIGQLRKSATTTTRELPRSFAVAPDQRARGIDVIFVSISDRVRIND
jgi:hypothetical protein